MFKELVYTILKIAGYNSNTAYNKLGYKTSSSLQSAIYNKDIKLTVLANICKLCGFDIIITNNKGVTINVLDYISQQAEQERKQE